MTKEQFKVKYAGGHYGDVKSLENKLAELAGLVYDAVKFRGTGTAAVVQALTVKENGDQYRIITTGGNLNTGGDIVAVVVKDLVQYNGETGLWFAVTTNAT